MEIAYWISVAFCARIQGVEMCDIQFDGRVEGQGSSACIRHCSRAGLPPLSKSCCNGKQLSKQFCGLSITEKINADRFVHW